MAFLLSLTVFASTAYATDKTELDLTVDAFTVNEFDYILSLQAADSATLSTYGLSNTEASRIVREFYTEFDNRALMNDYDLQGLGYSEHQISLLRDYAEGATLSNSQMRGLTGTCTGSITAESCNARDAEFSYCWEWDHCPVMTFQDAAAMRWLAVDSEGHYLDCSKESVNVDIEYYWYTTHKFTRHGELETGLEFNTVSVQFDETEIFYSSTTLPEQAYAKEGIITVEVALEQGVNNSIAYMKVAGLYGHSVVDIGDPSVSVDMAMSVSISFTGGLSTDKIAGRQAHVLRGGTINYQDD